ncbi:ribonucleoside-diphosphate reductase subunit alpha [Pseudonocardia spinosispora]|uniref:ribonucleoside-diphosphate reductase subunit alpha n=1 Tax=Pseudonocardia spinosispora TaxID=103441 RepID=UPI00041CBD90|nr:ribonucleoside-diphosphate reductase subunit alpha [Pseudonocardia spinosispora]
MTATQEQAPPRPRPRDTEIPVVKRNGETTAFDSTKISSALTRAFLDVEGTDAGSSSRVRAVVAELTEAVELALLRHAGPDRALHIEDIQDQVELALMRGGQHQVARSYVLYREEHAKARAASGPSTPVDPTQPTVRLADGTSAPIDVARLERIIAEACEGLTGADADRVLSETRKLLYDGMSTDELDQAPVLAARALVETDPDHSFVSSRLLLDLLRREAFSALGLTPPADQAETARRYPEYLAAYLRRGIELGQLDPALAEFDLDRITSVVRPERDLDFGFLGLQTLYDRYLLHSGGKRYELPQAFFLRVSMGLALREIDRETRASEFYGLLSVFDVMCSTPTLFNAGTTRPQLSSCFLTSIPDDLPGIFGAISDNALLSKYAGGLGNDWTPVRGIGAHIKGTNGESQGVVPFMKIANDTAVAVNQGGKRKGAVCAYLETWHIDVEEFLDLRKNTGDDRRRTHDMNTANWVPDEFLRRVRADADWTLFSPDEAPDLHDLYGDEFTEAYHAHEEAAARGERTVFRTVRAVDLWRRMLTMLFETGHPWITFKDPCNVRSPQRHAGVVHSSNLCTEITLNTTGGTAGRSADEVAVCNLASVNLARHVTANGIDTERLARTVRTAVRMLDNVIDINFYTIPSARRSNLRHRPVGLGLMGHQDALFTLRIPMASEKAVEFADESMELISYHAISASSDLAAERGRYDSYLGSLWSQGVLPIDSVELLAATRRDGELELDRTQRLDWDGLRSKVLAQGMRNSNVMAIAPTATIANITGVNPSIEPLYRNLYVKSNMSGDFTVVNEHLVRDLAARGLWDQVMVGDLKYFDGALGEIERVPAELKELYATAFEIDSKWLIEAAARRQKWLDQAQSLNLYLAQPSGRALDALYQLAWVRGLKTTYYLRSQAATRVEKSTLATTDGRLNAVAPAAVAAAPKPVDTAPVLVEGAACSIDDPDCEACQ